MKQHNMNFTCNTGRQGHLSLGGNQIFDPKNVQQGGCYAVQQFDAHCIPNHWIKNKFLAYNNKNRKFDP